MPGYRREYRRTLIEFRDALVRHGCLSSWNGDGHPRYGFVHGNWALANSSSGRYCGVNEDADLAETDVMLISPCPLRRSSPAFEDQQPLRVCTRLWLNARHIVGAKPACKAGHPNFSRSLSKGLCHPFSDAADGWAAHRERRADRAVTAHPERLRAWEQAAITVTGRPDWIFIAALSWHGSKG
jgi:hypothetical protein